MITSNLWYSSVFVAKTCLTNVFKYNSSFPRSYSFPKVSFVCVCSHTTEHHNFCYPLLLLLFHPKKVDRDIALENSTM